MLCDPATRYQSRLFNPEFLRSKGLEPPEWLARPTEVEADFIPVPAGV
jgi:cysteine synthase A